MGLIKRLLINDTSQYILSADRISLLNSVARDIPALLPVNKLLCVRPDMGVIFFT